MKIAYVFLPLYFGLLAGFVGHSVRIALVGAVVGLVLAMLLSREARRRPRPDASMTAIDAPMKKALNRGGRRSQKIWRRIIATVSKRRAAVVIGMYMPFIG